MNVVKPKFQGIFNALEYLWIFWKMRLVWLPFFRPSYDLSSNEIDKYLEYFFGNFFMKKIVSFLLSHLFLEVTVLTFESSKLFGISVKMYFQKLFSKTTVLHLVGGKNW